MTPAKAKARLVEGNKRFTSGERLEPQLSHLKLAELAKKGQKPFAIVLTCSDSRSPAELIFDQGLGDLFVVRVAGNVVAASLLASIEFAASNFESAVIVVLGHTQCGAVHMSLQHYQNPTIPLPSSHLEELEGRIRPAVEILDLEEDFEIAAVLDLAVKENVLRSMRLIKEQSTIIRDLLSKKKISIEGAILDVLTGKVQFFS